MSEMRRIVILGTTGSGKSTLGKQLAAQLGMTHVELDRLHWLANWQMQDTDTFRRQVDEALSTESWVVDGNYSKARDIVWARADTIIWLDYPLRIIYWRLFRRTMRRIISREDLWQTGNRESFRKQFLSKDSLFIWAWTSKVKQRKNYPSILSQPEYAQLIVLTFRYPKDTSKWLKTLEKERTLS